jgi:hypothetical protein
MAAVASPGSGRLGVKIAAPARLDQLFEIKSANFWRIGQSVLSRAWRKFYLLNQSSMIPQNNRVD